MSESGVREARSTTRRVGRTFALACRLLPREVRDDVYLLYLVFRLLDDAVDDAEPDAEERIAAVEAWASGAPARSDEARMLERLDQRHPLPRSAFTEFCAGMRDDLYGVTIHDDADLDRYCWRVAGTVGVVMAHVLGMRDPQRALPAAAALGQAMQCTNILRDIDEDRAAGRLYVPQSAIERFGGSVDPGSRAALLRDQIARADALYDIGCAGIPLLLRGQRAIRAAAAMYREILRQIERDGYGAHSGRAVVPRRRKLLVAALAQ
jgi:phytoene synthase